MSTHQIVPVDKPVQTDAPLIGLELVEVDLLVRASEARNMFGVDGTDTTVAVLDTGLRTSHIDFAGRVVAARNFTQDNGGNVEDAADGQGHGTNVAGIIAAGGIHIGIAPKARVLPMKVLGNLGGGDFAAIEAALQWVIDNRDTHKLSAVCMSLSDGKNYTNDSTFATNGLRDRIRQLRQLKIPCVVAAGNHYFTHQSAQGMAYPAILRETISVGAVYDADEGSFSYNSGAKADSTAPDRVTPFSQRLHESVSPDHATKIFAPGAPVTSSGIRNDTGESTQQGTSQATPVITGVVLLMQSLYKRATGELPDVDNLVTWLRAGSVRIVDGDDEHDNVRHTNKEFHRVSAPGALQAVVRHLQMQILRNA